MNPKSLAASSLTVVVVALMFATGSAGASSWAVALRTSSSGEARAQAVPSAPTGVTAICVSSSEKLVTVTWDVAAASSYTVYKSATVSGSYTSTASGLTATTWTSGTLATGNVYFKVAAYVGTKWVSAESQASPESTISSSGCIQP
jgi:cellulose 1,4-beta-cellobiosidase